MFHALITGGSGFIGVHLANKLLNKKCRVTLVDNFNRGKKDRHLTDTLNNKDCKLIELDLSSQAISENLPKDVEVIFHCAAIVGVENVVREPFRVLSLNNLLTENVISYAKSQKNLKSFVFFSTSEVYAASHGVIEDKFPTPETYPLVVPDLLQPRSSYALSKIYGEALCHASGLPFIIVRPHNIYGPRMGNSHVIPQLVQRIKAADSMPVEIFSPGHTRTFCYIDDATEYLYLLANTATKGQILNLGVSSPEKKIIDIAEFIREKLNSDVKLINGPDTPGSPYRRVPCTVKLIESTNYLPATSFESGVSKTIDWYISSSET